MGRTGRGWWPGIKTKRGKRRASCASWNTSEQYVRGGIYKLLGAESQPEHRGGRRREAIWPMIGRRWYREFRRGTDGRTTEPGFFARGGKRGDCGGAHDGIRRPAPCR